MDFKFFSIFLFFCFFVKNSNSNALLPPRGWMNSRMGWDGMG